MTRRPPRPVREPFGVALRPRRPRVRAAVVVACCAGAWLAVTLALRGAREALEQEHAMLAYLMLVLVGSALGPRLLGFALALASVVAINVTFQFPLDRVGPVQLPDAVVLVAFALVAGVTTQLLALARDRAETAELRAREVATLARIGAETLGTGDRDAAVLAVADAVRSLAGVPACSVLGADGDAPLAVAHRAGDASALPPVVAAVPLVAGEAAVGTLRLHDARPWEPDDARRRAVEALSYYGALAIERQRLEAEVARTALLEESERVRDLVLGAVSHDLRTPLTTIRALAQGAAAAPTPDAAARIDEQAARLERLVANLLDLSRMRADAFPVAPEPNVAEDLLGAVARQVHGRTAREGAPPVALVVRHDPHGAVLLGHFDFAQCVRAVGNLVENAVRASPPGAAVELSATTDGTWLVIEVADRGPGIEPAEAARLYQPFQRGAGAAADGGTGLGLAIAQAIAQAHGGWLRHAARDGGGTAFRFAVPLAHGDDAGDARDDVPGDAHARGVAAPGVARGGAA